jgi:hypothetical protein
MKILWLSEKKCPDIVEHFPENIPAGHRMFGFISFQVCFQADSFILLGFRVSQEIFQEYENRFHLWSPKYTAEKIGQDFFHI